MKSLRKFLMLCLCSLAAVPAISKGPFAIYDDAIPVDTQTGRAIWKSILQEKPITLNLTLPPSEERNRGMLLAEIKKSFNSWFKDSAALIRKSGRANEFSDVLPVLEKGLAFDPNGFNIKITLVDNPADLDKICGLNGVLGCANVAEYEITIPNQATLKEQLQKYHPGLELVESLNSIFAHEFGHQLGFSDQYMEHGLLVSIDEIAPQAHSTQRYVTETVMSGGKDNGKIGCDDTDGIINMIDLQRGGAQGKRKNTVWKSFCPGSADLFKDGKLTEGYIYRIRKVNSTLWGIDRGTGKLVEENLRNVMHYKVNPQNGRTKEKIVKKDKLNRPILGKGPNHIVIYYEYFQGIVRKAAFARYPKSEMDGLVWVEESYSPQYSPEKIAHTLYWVDDTGLRTHTWEETPPQKVRSR